MDDEAEGCGDQFELNGVTHTCTDHNPGCCSSTRTVRSSGTTPAATRTPSTTSSGEVGGGPYCGPVTTVLADRERAGAYLDARTLRGDGPDDCWLWQNKPDRDGYGVANHAGRQWRAHRLSYTFHVGPIPDGHDLDHTCEVRLCVRPSHLEPVTNFENFVRKYLREGRDRETAEQLATWDLERVAREHERKVAMRAAQQELREAGIFEGALVRVGAGKATWTLTRLTAGGPGPIEGASSLWAYLTSTASGQERTERVSKLTPAGA